MYKITVEIKARATMVFDMNELSRSSSVLGLSKLVTRYLFKVGNNELNKDISTAPSAACPSVNDVLMQ